MRKPWFFAEPRSWNGEIVELSPEESRHAVRSLRVKTGDEIVVIDGLGRQADCVVTGEGGHLRARVVSEIRRAEPEPRITVYQAASKGTKLDSVVERLAELGTAELRCFSSERSIVRWDALKTARLNERWGAIARSAAKQSRGAHVLRAEAGLSWPDLLDRVATEPFALCLWEDATLPMRAVLGPEISSVALVVGPEGGFTRDEAEALADAGAPSVSLGERILRTENAALVAASAVMYHYGLLG